MNQVNKSIVLINLVIQGFLYWDATRPNYKSLFFNNYPFSTALIASILPVVILGIIHLTKDKK